MVPPSAFTMALQMARLKAKAAVGAGTRFVGAVKAPKMCGRSASAMPGRCRDGQDRGRPFSALVLTAHFAFWLVLWMELVSGWDDLAQAIQRG